MTNLVIFIDGKNLGQAQDAYTKAYNKLSQNKGNVIRQAEMLKELGVKPTRSLPSPLVDRALDEEAMPAPAALPQESEPGLMN